MILVAAIFTWWWVGRASDQSAHDRLSVDTRAAEAAGGAEEDLPLDVETRAAARKRIVVLPFENLGPPEHQYFAAGMTEEITSRLAKIKELGVISRNTATQYRDIAKSTQEIGRELDVGYVLEGSVRWAPAEDGPDRIRITPQLVRVKDDTHLWAATFDSTLDDVFRVQTEIAREIIGELELALTAPERRAVQTRPTENLTAYHTYLRGRHHFDRKIGSPENARAAIASFERAVELDPDFALAWAHLAQARSWLFHGAVDRSPSNCRAAGRAAERAVSLDSRLPEAHLGKAYYHYWCELDYEEAFESLEKARRGLPSDSEILALQGFILRRNGLWRESTADLERAVELDPRSAALWTQLAVSYLNLKRYAEAVSMADRSIALDPSRSGPYQWKGWIVFMRNGDPREAERVLRGSGLSSDGVLSYRATWLRIAKQHQRALELLEDVETDYSYISNFHHSVELARGQLLEALALKTEAGTAYRNALEMLNEKIAKRPEDPSVHAALALAHSGLGNREQALRHGERAAELRPIGKDAMMAPVYLAVLGEIYAQAGEIEGACSTIEEVLSIPSQFSQHWFEQHPAFADLQDEPCFQGIREKYPPRYNPELNS